MKKKAGTSPRVLKKREQARQEILQTAREILRKAGVDAVTLASVATELGMTKQALYHYYPSKEDLMQALVTSFISDEVEALISAVESNKSERDVLGTMINAFYNYYIRHMDRFRAVYGQTQLYSGLKIGLDEQVIRSQINPRTRELFDLLEERLSRGSRSKVLRKKMRLLAFSAWTSALGLLTILSVTEAVQDPLLHTDRELLKTIGATFNQAAGAAGS